MRSTYTLRSTHSDRHMANKVSSISRVPVLPVVRPDTGCRLSLRPFLCPAFTIFSTSSSLSYSVGCCAVSGSPAEGFEGRTERLQQVLKNSGQVIRPQVVTIIEFLQKQVKQTRVAQAKAEAAAEVADAEALQVSDEEVCSPAEITAYRHRQHQQQTCCRADRMSTVSYLMFPGMLYFCRAHYSR